MAKFQSINYLFLFFTLAFSCAENEVLIAQSPSEISLDDCEDKLKFTSGIRSIYQDSKGNYWFGSHQEGVCLFNGDSLTYFTTEDGLSDNQVRTIQEDKKGTIWFGTGNGISCYNGKEIINYNTHKSLNEILSKQEVSSGIIL